jgi:type IV pilus assembly protein PilP
MIRVVAAVACGLLVGACSQGTHQDLRQWMDEQGKGARGNVEPLPQIRPYEPFAYNAFDLPDPFRPRKVETVRPQSTLQPDLDRRKEPLEAFPLETLAMVGTLQRGQTMHALIRTSEKDIYRVRVGNHMGQNFGVIVGIDESEIRLKELVQDSGGDWTERTSNLLLADAEQNKEQKK